MFMLHEMTVSEMLPKNGKFVPGLFIKHKGVISEDCESVQHHLYWHFFTIYFKLGKISNQKDLMKNAKKAFQ